MKKKLKTEACDYYALKKCFKIMKIFLFIMVLSMGQLLAIDSYSQKTMISLDFRQSKLVQVLDEIENQSDYYFLFNEKLIDVDRKVDISVKDQEITNILTRLFTGTNIEFQVIDRKIVLSPGKITSSSESVQQQLKVSGKVTDSSGNPLPGVTVVVKGTTQGTITDGDGRYSLSNVPNDAALVFSFVGMKTQEIPVAKKTSVNVTLTEEAIGIEEVVAIGYGTQKKENLTGAVSTVSGEQLVNKPILQTSMALQGLSPGVTVTQSSGQPGYDYGTIRIRGISTIDNSAPLVLIDGISGDINDVNSNDIESISVLKDAASSAIYGSRASNGIILITTKRAKENQVRVSYNGLAGVQEFTDLPDFTDGYTYMQTQNLARTNLGLQPVWSEEYMKNYLLYKETDPDHYPDTDWQDVMFQGSGFQQQHNLSIAAGNNNLRTLASFSYDQQMGNVKKFEFDRYVMRINNDIDISSQLSFKFDINILKSTLKQPKDENTIFYSVNRAAPTDAAYLSNGKIAASQSGTITALIYLYNGYSKKEDFNFTGRFGGTYKPIKGLSLDFWYSPEYYTTVTKSFSKPVDFYLPDSETPIDRTSNIQGSLSETWTRTIRYTGQLWLTYEKAINNHNFKFLGGVEAFENKNKNISAYREDFTFINYEVFDAGSVINWTNGGTETENALLSCYSRLTYDYKSKYLFEANLRRDGSSRFGAGHRWGWFPSASVGYRISEEPFIKDRYIWLSNLKFRASWGQLGNQTIGYNYNFASTINLSGQGYVFGGNIVNGAALTQLNNANLTWETAEKTNFALDLGLFNNSLTGTFEYYINNTKDILLTLPIPAMIGLSAPYQNAGKVENKGWEFSLGYKGKIKKFSYDIGIVLSDVKNKITDFKGLESISGATINKEGYPIGSYYGYKSDGLFQTQEEVDALGGTQIGTIARGDIKYIDQNTIDTDGDGINDSTDGKINSDDRVVLGSNIPRYEFGINLNAEFKGIDFSCFIQGVGKRDVLLSADAIWAFSNSGKIQKWQLDYWSENNPNASYPRLTATTSHNNFNYSDYWMYDASYIRVKTLSIGYTIPSKFLKWTKLDRCRIYFVGNNLFTIKNMPAGWDPERPTGGTEYYPLTSTYAFGINVNF
jgi:TonB-linked SusC/RagA family outer membrane protein